MAAAVQTTSLCDFCHQKPKFNGHPYCGKTCASQAATTLCAQCHQKPKFGNHDYCGKSCAQAAAAAGAPHKGAGRGGKPQRPQQAPQYPPQQQQAPQAPRAPAAPRAPGRGGAPQAPARGTYHSAQQRGAPFGQHGIGSAPPAPAPNVNVLAVYGGAPSPPPQHAGPPPPPERCVLPGCTVPAHVDANGLQTSDYCSQRHREEAVTTGFAEPCIMCQIMPQGRVDHFCSRECREQALQK